MQNPDSLSVFLRIAGLSLISFGGQSTIVPDIIRYVTQTNVWMTERQFTEIFSLGQISPGPNCMYITLVGWRISGITGAIATTLGLTLPPATMALGLASLYNPKSRSGAAFKGGMVPITVGLLLTAALIITRLITSDFSKSWSTYLVVAITAWITVKTKWHSLILIGAGTLIGLFGIIN